MTPNSTPESSSTKISIELGSSVNHSSSFDSSHLSRQAVKNSYRWKLVGSALLFIAGFLYLTYGIEIRLAEILNATGNFSWTTVLISLLLAVLQSSAQGLRLWALLPNEAGTSVLGVLRLFSLGQLANTFLPGRAGDLYKIVSLSQFALPPRNRSPEPHPSFGADRIVGAAGSVLIADKTVDLATLLLLIVLVAPAWLDQVSLPHAKVGSLGIIIFSVLAVFILVGGFFLIRSQRHLSGLSRLFSALLRGSSGLVRWRKLLPAFLFGFTAWTLEALILITLSSTWEWQLSLGQAIGVLVVLNLGIALPISFANLGTFEAAIAFGLSRLHVPIPEALAFAGVHHLLQMIGVANLALMSSLLFQRSRRKVVNREFRAGPSDKKRAIEYFDSLSEEYNSSVTKGPLRFLREKERGAILDFADLQGPSKRTMIDVGCGGGFYALAAKRSGLKVCAVDLASGMVEKLKGQVDEAYVSDLDSLEMESRFDIVVCSGALDFVLDPERSFQNLCRLVAPGGRLVIQAPRAGLFGWIYRLEKKALGIRVNLFPTAWFQEQGTKQGLKLVDCRYPLPTNQVVLLVRKRNP